MHDGCLSLSIPTWTPLHLQHYSQQIWSNCIHLSDMSRPSLNEVRPSLAGDDRTVSHREGSLTCVALTVQSSRRVHVEKGFCCLECLVKTHDVVTRHRHWRGKEQTDSSAHMLDINNQVLMKTKRSTGICHNTTTMLTQPFPNVDFLIWVLYWQPAPPFLFPVICSDNDTRVLPASRRQRSSLITLMWNYHLKWTTRHSLLPTLTWIQFGALAAEK